MDRVADADDDDERWAAAVKPRADFPDDARIHGQAGVEYRPRRRQTAAPAWGRSATELAVRIGHAGSALEQLVSLRASRLSALGYEPDQLQA